MKTEQIHGRLTDLLSPAAMRWAEASCAAVAAHPPALFELSAVAGLRCGRAPLGCDLPDWTADDAVRALMLCSLPLDGPELVETVAAVYRQGDTLERRAVLRTLPLLAIGDEAVPLVRDALRTNDPRLIAVALGPYAAEQLDQRSWRDGVLKCLFMGVPLVAVAGLDRRSDPELIRMFRDYAAERAAAGRSVPTDLRILLDSQET
ncbi:EboA domain-containing protein [Actinoallomurus vinaceus]|uniref:EboA domain-containing protein n=1 Tax=Actinoallomurus vinaceus TaxID=1080074 RepID=A0ABP8USG7_9ACTN